ncbi:hypothetical protein J8I87_21820 [Paraburkholderia sp. LEh10]|uniref:hypothetical protein n=1 Tax=Paraburkholderia sp. LEh10 TaxID=2821353 RepID=UPI001AE37F57|nr:hypothetical protein [Paraburkholderia sp. LEh10]MBP0592320.1 hypothetical protein [Paraburkholderia sp. LEh10]
MNFSSNAVGAIAAIFAAIAAVGYAQTGWHPATQSDKSMATPGATSGELKTPRPGQSSTPGISGAASDPGVLNSRRAHSKQGAHDSRKPTMDAQRVR